MQELPCSLENSNGRLDVAMLENILGTAASLLGGNLVIVRRRRNEDNTEPRAGEL